MPETENKPKSLSELKATYDESIEETAEKKSQEKSQAEEESQEESAATSEEQETASTKQEEEEPVQKEQQDDEAEDDSEEVDNFSLLNRQLGVDLEVETDWSLEGMAKYVETYAQASVANYLEQIKESYPNAYKALQYEANGGNPADLFKPEASLPVQEVSKDSEKNQRQVLEYYFGQKGLPEQAIETLIKSYEDQGELYNQAKSAYDEIQKNREQYEQEELRKQEEQRKAQENKDREFISSLSSTVANRKIGNFNVPQKDLKGFNDYVSNLLQYDGNGGYQFSLSANDSDAMTIALQAAYLAYKKGDIGDIIERKAATAKLKGFKPKSAKKETDSRKPKSLKDLAREVKR